MKITRLTWNAIASKLSVMVYQEVLWHDRTRIRVRTALRCTLAIVAIILAGELMQQRAVAGIMCGGALTVGSGVYQRIGRSQIGPMVLAMLGMGISAALGTLAGLSPGVLVAAVAMWGFVAGILPVLGGGGQWIGQQWAVALLVASSFPGTLDHALIRAGLVMGGGALQIASVEASLRFGDIRTELKGWSETTHEARQGWATLRGAITSRSTSMRFALSVAAVLAAAVLTERMLALPNGYWVGMTTLLLMRQQFHDTWHRSASRVGGTLAGAALVILAARTGAPTWMFAVAIPVTAFFCFALQQFSYALFSFYLTAYIVLLLAYGGLPEQMIVYNRIVGTMIGAGFALGGHLLFLSHHDRLRKSGAAAV